MYFLFFEPDCYNIRSNNSINKQMNELFEMVANQFQTNNQYDKFIKESEKEFDIKIYHLSTFSINYARSVYAELAQKYRDKLLKPNPSGWYENERRLYVWFILSFIQAKLLDPVKFLDAYDKYWRHISETFWQKEVYFLKYQLQNVLKAKGRTTWCDKEDDLLRKIFPKFAVGEWNQIAKQFYHLSEGKFFKTPKQCRERWQNHLNDKIRKGGWTIQEDLIIFEFITANTRKTWAKIVPKLENTRTEHMIKNRYKSLTTKVMQERNLREAEAAAFVLKNLQRKKEIGIEEAESELIMEPQQEGEGSGRQQQKTPKRELFEPYQSKSFIKCSQGRDCSEMKLQNGLPSFMASIMRDDSNNYPYPSMVFSSSHFQLNNSSRFCPNINLASNIFFTTERPRNQQQRLFFENDSVRTTRSGKIGDSINGTLNGQS